MSAQLSHFAIHANDVTRAKAFYEQVFGWSIRPWGPPNFYQIFYTEDPAEPPRGAIQERHEPLSGTGLRGVEPTFGVESLEETIKAIEAAGGQIDMHPFHIDGAGDLVFFIDTEGNRIGAMQYER
jgi:predicted enzyme related to lactoylglutathione lyase